MLSHWIKRQFAVLAVALGALAFFGCMHQKVMPEKLPSELLPFEKQPETAEEILHALRTADSLQSITNPDDFRCQLILPVVNKMRHLGKLRVLDILARYYREDRRRDLFSTPEMPSGAIVVLSRLLFVPPEEGWKTEYYFNAYGTVAQTSAKAQFPLWPLAVSRGVPFLLQGIGNFGGAIPDEDTSTLDRCAGLNLISADWPTTGFNEAAASLIESTSFKALPSGLDSSWRMDRADLIRAQAGIRVDDLNLPVSAIAGLASNDERQRRGVPVLSPKWITNKDDIHCAVWLNPAAIGEAARHLPMQVGKCVVVNMSQGPEKEIDTYQSGKQYHSLYVQPGATLWETLTITFDYRAAAQGSNPWRCEVNCGAHERPATEEMSMIEAESILKTWGINRLE